MRYCLLIRDMSKFNLRLQMVTKAKKISISETARYYGTTRKTVRKWIKRYDLYGLRGLKDQKRIPGRIPHKMGQEDEIRIRRIT